MTCFYGRQDEIKRILKVLKQGKNLVLQGKYGVGKTHLVRHFARRHRNQWKFLFADFEKNPARIIGNLFRQIKSACPSIKLKDSMPYRIAKSKLIDVGLKDPGHYVIVLDNIARVTGPKATFLRDLTWEHGFIVIALAEGFLSADNLMRLRAGLMPCELIRLDNLRLNESIMFFKQVADRNQFHWTQSRIRAFAEATHGYPLLMADLVDRYQRNDAEDLENSLCQSLE
jgi:hypothetical protein